MTDPKTAISRTELVALMAMLTATVAFAIDAMLPAIPAIGADLSPGDPNKAQLVIATFVIGLGVGTFFTGPLSDAFGRRPVAVAGAIIYTFGALLSAVAPSLELLLAARLLQGLGAAGPRVACMAIVRDLFSGRQMAQIVSFIIFVFTLAPVFAPSIGWALAWAFGWRAIFVSFAVFALVSTVWLLIRQPETLAPENRRPFKIQVLIAGTREILGNPQVVVAILVQTLIFGTLFAALMSSQQVFEQVFHKGETFPLWFGFMAILAAGSNLLNASIVMKVGMRNVVKWALLVQAAFTLVFLVTLTAGLLDGAILFPVAFVWFTSIFYLAGFGIGNMNAIALEPVGHIAGLAASIVTALSTIGAALLAAPIGQAFDGTIRPLAIGALVLVALAFLLVLRLKDNEALS